MKSLAHIYAFIVLVGGGAFFGFVLGCFTAFVNSLIWFYGFRADLGAFIGVLSLSLPTIAGAIYGYRAWVKRVRADTTSN